ncbi:MAG: C2H2-type zinc finger protein [Desulfobacteraceae bacterium]|nr:C2H2-type zinc finger protein [Desulfobacteraceae bacterium]
MSNKCNQCDYSSSQADNLRRHLKRHSGEKSNKCNQCEFASIQAGDLKTHMKTHSGESLTNATNANLHPIMQGLKGHI